MTMTTDHDVAIIGTGFAGLATAVRLKEQGIDDFVVFERGDDVGGTWHYNTYPGCACDIPSHLYCFSFAPNPGWTRTFSSQGEIRAYLRDCADRFGIRPHVRLRHTVENATWDEESQRWHIETSEGDFSARVLVASNGPFADPRIPDFPGVERFQGKTMHSGHWDHEHDLTGERVAVIGTGASAVQFVPAIQPKVERLHLFQRSAPWIMPSTNRPTTRLERAIYKRLPAIQRLVRNWVFVTREWMVLGFVKEPRLMVAGEAVSLAHLRRSVRDPELRRKLRPNYKIGCKRVLPSNRWYPALCQPNVDVVTDGIAEIREHSIVDGEGVEREVDTIIFGTGFQTTTMPLASRIQGRDETTLAEAWGESPTAYLGSTVAGFPNLFLLLGPNTGLGHSSMIYMIEAQVKHFIRAMTAMSESGAATVEVRADAQETYNRDLERKLKGTVWTTGCTSWYVNETGRVVTAWPDWTWQFGRRAARFDAAAYSLGEARVPAPEPAVVAA